MQGLRVTRFDATSARSIVSESRRHVLTVLEHSVLDEFGGTGLLGAIRAGGGKVLVVALPPVTTCASARYADGFVTADDDIVEVVGTVRRLCALEDAGAPGHGPAGSGTGRRIADPLAELSPRERAVLDGMMRGLSAAEIADEQFVSIPTVRSQIRAILRKLDVRSQLAAVAVAHRSGRTADGGQNHQL